jgi:hypothetical protein
MMYLFGYQDVKGMLEERRARSLRRLVASGLAPVDGYQRPIAEPEAEIVELVFAAACDTDRIGA